MDSYMEGFTSSFHSFKSSFPLIDIDQNMELLNQFPIQYDNSNMSCQGFSNHNILSQQVLPLLDHPFIQNFQPVLQHGSHKNAIMIPEAVATIPVVNRKRKSIEVSSSSFGNSSSHQSSRKGKKVKPCDIGEAPEEVVHVRARRGQATDSHSIAERARREKINERLRCLQEIVPGCNKSMGMAVMLDEIINYVQSLQNQVEFLSMKLTEASRFHKLDSVLTNIGSFQIGNAVELVKSLQRPEETEEICPLDRSFG